MTENSSPTPLDNQSDQPAGLGEIMQRYNIRPNKRLGQNFLSAPNILDKIVDAAQLTRTSTVLEIGAGLGTLTRRLADIAGRVVAVELDRHLVHILESELGYLPNLELVQGDILEMTPAELMECGAQATPSNPLKTPPYKVVANLPYYITSAIIRHLLETECPPERLVLMVQREVADRITASPGNMSLLAVSVQFFGEPRVVTRVPAGAFIPPPQVDSAVISIDVFPNPPVEVSSSSWFFRVAKAGFGQKRKQLKNTLASRLGLPMQQILDALNQAQIDPKRRAQTLTLEEWASLCQELDPSPKPQLPSLDK